MAGGCCESAPDAIGRITLDVKQAGKRSAGNPHAAFDEAGAGNVIMGAGLRTNAKVVGFSTGPYRRRASPRPYQVRAWPGPYTHRIAGGESSLLHDRGTGLELEDLAVESAAPRGWRGDAFQRFRYQWIWQAGTVAKSGRNTVVLKLPAGEYFQRFGVALPRLATL